MRSEKVGAATMLSQIVQMVANAQRSKAPDAAHGRRGGRQVRGGGGADRARHLLCLGLFGPEPSWVFGLINAVAVLIIACPVRWGWPRRCR
jgi:Cu+-exporting ATPase